MAPAPCRVILDFICLLRGAWFWLTGALSPPRPSRMRCPSAATSGRCPLSGLMVDIEAGVLEAAAEMGHGAAGSVAHPSSSFSSSVRGLGTFLGLAILSKPAWILCTSDPRQEEVARPRCEGTVPFTPGTESFESFESLSRPQTFGWSRPPCKKVQYVRQSAF